MILDEIIKNKQAEVAEAKKRTGVDQMIKLASALPKPKDFAGAISNPVSLIAEVKKASPSAGIIREDFDPVAIVKEYESAGACAVSVLTDERYFKGKLADLAAVSKSVNIPVLRKDFTIDEYQIYEARAFGADAILLIAAVLTDEQLLLFSKTAGDLGMSYIIEVHTAEELERVMSVSRHPLIIGINNRDLKTMRVDISTTFKLIKFIPKTTITVSESGIRTKEDIGRVKESGVNAVLVGESLMSSGNIASKIKELLS